MGGITGDMGEHVQQESDKLHARGVELSAVLLLLLLPLPRQIPKATRTKAESGSAMRPSIHHTLPSWKGFFYPIRLLPPQRARSIGAVPRPKSAISHNHNPKRAGLSLLDRRMHGMNSPYLSEADIGALFPEALAADIEAVFADQTGGVGADAAVLRISRQLLVLVYGNASC